MGSPLTALLINCAALVLPVSARGGRFWLAARWGREGIGGGTMEPRRSTMGGTLTALPIDCAALVLPVSARGGRSWLAACASRTHERTQARTRAVVAGALLRKSKVNKYARGDGKMTRRVEAEGSRRHFVMETWPHACSQGSLGDEQVWRDTSGLPGSNPPILHTTIFMHLEFRA